MLRALVHIDAAVGTTESVGALARVSGALVDAARAVLARVHLLGAELNFLLAVLAFVKKFKTGF